MPQHISRTIDSNYIINQLLETNYYKAPWHELEQNIIQYGPIGQRETQRYRRVENRTTRTELSYGSCSLIPSELNPPFRWPAAYLFCCQCDWQFFLSSRSAVFHYFLLVGSSTTFFLPRSSTICACSRNSCATCPLLLRNLEISLPIMVASRHVLTATQKLFNFKTRARTLLATRLLL